MVICVFLHLRPPAGLHVFVIVCFLKAHDQTVNTVLSSNAAVKIKKPIKTKFRMPVFNWVALKPNQINGTVFNEIDDERILEVSVSLGQHAPHGGGVTAVFFYNHDGSLFSQRT